MDSGGCGRERLYLTDLFERLFLMDSGGCGRERLYLTDLFVRIFLMDAGGSCMGDLESVRLNFTCMGDCGRERLCVTNLFVRMFLESLESKGDCGRERLYVTDLFDHQFVRLYFKTGEKRFYIPAGILTMTPTAALFVQSRAVLSGMGLPLAGG
jgi:hypothetical protein